MIEHAKIDRYGVGTRYKNLSRPDEVIYHSGVAWSHGELFDAEFGNCSMSSTHARLAYKNAKHTYIL